MSVRESQIEEILATYPDICADLIGIKEELVLIGRQKILPSGDRLDLLFAHGSRLILVELKVVPFKEEFLIQTQGYWRELEQLQAEEQLISGEITAYLLCPHFLPKHIASCVQMGVRAIEYDPSQVLEMFFSRFNQIAAFFSLQPPDHGVWSLHLLNPILYSLENGRLSLADIRKGVGLALTTIGNYLRFAEELKLVYRETPGFVQLSGMGNNYVNSRDPNRGFDSLSEAQVKVLKDLIIKDPFSSRVVLGIYTMVEVIFNLARNVHPVPEQMVISHFRDASGKAYKWQSPTAASHGAHMYSNYATELGLIGKIGRQFYLTPQGIRFILLLQLHKSIKVVDALGLAQS